MMTIGKISRPHGNLFRHDNAVEGYCVRIEDVYSELVKFWLKGAAFEEFWNSGKTSEGEYIWYELRRRPF